MPATDTQHGRKAPPRTGPKRKPVLQIGNVVAKTQRTWEHAQRPAPAPKQIATARAVEKTYRSQAGAVRRAAATQRTPGIGPGHAIRPPGHQQVLTQRRIDAARSLVAARRHEPALRGTSPVGDRPQGREQAMNRAPSYRAMPQDPNTGRGISTLKTPEPPRGSQQRGTSLSGDRPQGRAKEMRAAPTVKSKIVKGKGPGRVLATLSPTTLAGKYVAAVGWKDPRGAAGGGLDIASNAGRDTAELAVTTPSSLAHVGVQTVKAAGKAYTGDIPGAIKDYKQMGKEFVAPYKEAVKDPVKFVSERPVTSYLMFAPGVKVPLRAGAKTLRIAEGIRAERKVARGETPNPKKHTLVREPATLPGTALKETRTADKQPFGINAGRKIRGQKVGGRVTEPELKRRVDEHADQSRHREERRVAHAIDQAREQTKGQPKHERKQAIAEAGQQARDQARVESDQVFARDFGANVEPQTTVAHIAEAEAERARAKQFKKITKRTVKFARERVEQARARSRAAYAPEHAPELHAFETEREGLLRDLAQHEREHATSRVGLAEAKGRAATSQTKPATSPKLKELEQQRKGVERGPAYTGPSVEVLEKRVAGHEQALARQKAEGVNRGRGNMDTIAALNSAKKTLAEAREAASHPVTVSHAAVADARSAVSAADRKVNLIERQVQRAEERGSHLEGVTVGATRAGGMTSRMGRAAADQAERVGGLYDALHQAHAESQAARLHLKTVEKGHRATVRSAAKVVDEGIRDERRRIAGVAPDAADSLLSAIERRDTAAGRKGETRARLRDLDQRIAEERRQARLRGRSHVADARQEHQRAVEQHGTAVQVHRRLEGAAIDTARAHRETPLVNPTGEGRLFDNPQDAKRVVYRLNQQAHANAIPSGRPGQFQMREPGTGGKPVSLSLTPGEKPLLFKMRKVGEDQYAVVPKIAGQRMYGGGGKGAELSHASVGSGKATGARFLRTTRGALSKAVLGLSLKWLWGQGTEAGVRALIAGAGPADLIRFNRIVKRMNEIKPGAGDSLKDRVLGGQYDPHGAIGEQVLGTKTLAQEYEGTSLHGPAKAATWVGHAPGIKQVRGTVRGLTRLTMQGLNGAIENTAKKAMAGQVIRQGPLMEMRLAVPKLHGLTEKAIDDAAHGLMETHNQVEASRGLNEMYGKYRDQSPEMKSLLQHWTPFLPWYLNAGRFLFHTLPTRHPMKAALLANLTEADREWRMSKGLSFYKKPGGKERVPNILLGGYPVGGNRYQRIGHYLGPWGLGADPAESAAGLAVPQLTGPFKNLIGIDWKNQPLTKPGAKGEKRKPFNLGEKGARFGLTIAESQIPTVQQANRLSGLGAKYVDKREDPRSFTGRLKAELPTTPTKAPKTKTKKPKPQGFGSGGFGSGGFGASGL